MAQDMVELMSALGHERFALAGHDRGGRVAYRLPLDHPDRVAALGLIGRDPEFFLRQLMNRWAGERKAIDPAALDEYIRHFKKPSVIEATCEDYRAGATVDLDHDRADRDRNRKIRCPTLVLWSRRYLAAKAASPLEVRQSWADDGERWRSIAVTLSLKNGPMNAPPPSRISSRA
jgi:haloacetate dehalogenase